MKKIKLVSLICFLVMLVTWKAKAQDSTKNTVMIGLYQSLNPEYSKIVVTENGRLTEEIKIDPTSEVSLVLNQIEVHKVLQKYISDAYKVTTSSTGSMIIKTTQQSVTTTVYLLEK
jgi:hypothetical protein